jgi:hypothetical protein
MALQYIPLPASNTAAESRIAVVSVLAGSAIGVAVVFVVVFGEVLLLVMRHSGIFLNWRDVAVIGLGFGLATGLVGGLTRFFFWRVNSLRPRGLEVMGIWCILLAFVAQAIDPVLTVLGVEVR